MGKTTNDSKKVRWWPWLIGVIAIYIGYWYVIWISGWFSELEKGKFGDTFGALNALFAGLAFAGVIYAILLQQKELALQRKELKLQRKTLEATEVEVRGQKEQLQAQNQTLQKQNFESSFFQLLSMHNEIVNSLHMHGTNRDYSARECFNYILSICRIYWYNPDQAQNDTSKIKAKFRNHFDETAFDGYLKNIGHYFRHLYQVVKFVDQSDFIKEFEAKKFYTNLILAQLSSDELGLLFYHSLSDRGTEFKGLVERYALFENISSEVLIDEEHKKLYAPSAYGESD